MVPEGIDAFFVGDREYEATLQSYFPESEMVLFDPARSRYPISATEIRHNILGNWTTSWARPGLSSAKKVLIARHGELRQNHPDQVPGQAVQYLLVRGGGPVLRPDLPGRG